MRPEMLVRLRRIEAAYAVVALVLWLSIPFPPVGREWLLSVHWFGTALIAGALVLVIRRAPRLGWYGAVAFAMLALGTQLRGFVVALLAGPAMTPAWGPSLVVAAVPIGLQLAAAACCYYARPRGHSAPSTPIDRSPAA